MFRRKKRKRKPTQGDTQAGRRWLPRWRVPCSAWDVVTVAGVAAVVTAAWQVSHPVGLALGGIIVAVFASIMDAKKGV